MTEFEFKPRQDSGFTGHIKVKVPTYDDQCDAFEAINYELKDGELVMSKGISRRLKKIKEVVLNHTIECKVKFGEKEINSIDELVVYQEGKMLVNELGNMLLSGIKLGND